MRLPSSSPSKAALKRSGVWEEMLDDIQQCQTILELLRCELAWSVEISAWPADAELGWTIPATEQFEKRRVEIEKELTDASPEE